MARYLFALAYLVLCTEAVHAADRFVSTTGSDAANTCTSSAAPCATLQHALDESADGDTIKIAAGRYKQAASATDPGTIFIIGGYDDTFATLEGGETVLQSKTQRALGLFYTGTSTATVGINYITFARSISPDLAGNVSEAGGGLRIDATDDSYVTVVVQSCRFIGNRARYGGGAALTTTRELSDPPGTATIVGGILYSEFRGNKGSDGGGLFVRGQNASTPALQIFDTRFENNKAADVGGGVFYEAYGVPGGIQDFTRVTFVKNKARNDGGGAAFHAMSETMALNFENTVLIRNRARNSGGGFQFLADTSLGGPASIGVSLLHGSASGNAARFGGGYSVLAGDGLVDPASATILSTNEIVYDNDSLDVYGLASAGSSVSVTRDAGIHGPAQVGGAGTSSLTDNGVSNADPMFVQYGKNIHLSSGSPAIDAVSCANSPGEDFELDARPQGAQCDFGADEFEP